MKLLTGILVAAVIALGTGFTMATICFEDAMTKLEELRTQIAKPVPKPQKTEVAAAWVIRHSERISEVAAKHITDEVFKYPNPILILSLIEAESEFIPTAVSSAGAIGLGQIMYYVHKKDLADLGITTKRGLFDVEKNIKATSFVLQMMLNKSSGDATKALHFYLGGKDGKYVSRIFSNYVQLSMEIESAMPKV